MRTLVRTSQFKRDFKKRILSAADEVALADVLQRLITGAPLEPRTGIILCGTAGTACVIAT